MSRIFNLRYVLATSLVVAFLGIAGSPIVCPDRASAAEEKKLVNVKKQVRHERKKNPKLKGTKERRKRGVMKPLEPIVCPDFPLCDDD